MMYESAMMWRDLTDRHLYQQGDAFPFDGREIDQERIEMLLNGHFIVSKPVEKTDDKVITETPKAAKNRKRK